MRISILATAFGLVAITAIAAPLLPADSLPDVVYEPTNTAVPKMIENGKNAAHDALSAASIIAPRDTQSDRFKDLVRINDEDYELRYSEDFSDEVIATSTVRKIGYGKAQDVDIVTTPSGTYSSDGLASRNVRYPAVEATRARPWGHAGLTGATWVPGVGWVARSYAPARSVTTYGRIKGGGMYISGKGSTCFLGRGYATCN